MASTHKIYNVLIFVGVEKIFAMFDSIFVLRNLGR